MGLCLRSVQSVYRREGRFSCEKRVMRHGPRFYEIGCTTVVRRCIKQADGGLAAGGSRPQLSVIVGAGPPSTSADFRAGLYYLSSRSHAVPPVVMEQPRPFDVGVAGAAFASHVNGRSKAGTGWRGARRLMSARSKSDLLTCNSVLRPRDDRLCQIGTDHASTFLVSAFRSKAVVKPSRRGRENSLPARAGS